MTGAPVPNGADTVIRREDVVHENDTITVNETRDSGKNIRRRGEDFRAGETLFEAGEKISAAHIGAIASSGLQAVACHRRPTVAIISSGDELIGLEDFSADAAGKKIVSSNSLTLPSLIENAGGVPLDLGIARDDPVSLREKFEAAMNTDLIVTTAGMSVGDHDHVRGVFAALGGELVFWKVRMRPGAPMAFGIVNGIPWLGLSGNPVSAIVSFEVFVRPVIRRMLGMKCLFRKTIPVRTAHSITLAASLMHFLRVNVKSNREGTYDAELAGSQSSAVLTAMARANALLILPGDRLAIGEGEMHRALPLSDAFGESENFLLA